MVIDDKIAYSVGDCEVILKVPGADQVQPLIDFYRSYRRRCQALGDKADFTELAPTPAEVEQAAAAVMPFIEDAGGLDFTGFKGQLILTTLATYFYTDIFNIPEIKKK